jgi:uncharacterized membrane protein YeaQ/YmgE (transglycosylase-associated protein family)
MFAQPRLRESPAQSWMRERNGAMGIIGWILLGMIAGVIAKAILPGSQPGGVIVTTLVGIAGAIVAGFIAQALGFGDPIDEFFDFSTWVAAIIGAVALLLAWGAISNRGHGRTA